MKNDDTTTRVGGRPVNSGADDTGGLVERLLHAAGPGPDIPEDGAARVKDQIRPAWTAEVAARRRQRSRLWLGGVAAAAALLIVAIYLPFQRPDTPAPPTEMMVVAVIAGTLEVTPPGANVEFLTADPIGKEILPGSLLRTRAGNRATLWLTDQRSLRIDAESELRLDSKASLSLVSGAVYIDAQSRGGDAVEVRTAFGTATDIGTQFEVRLGEETLDVTVREGLVSLSREGDEIRITQGVALSIDATGAISTGAVAPHDPMWAWVQQIAPTFEIEGQSVLAFLDWVSSETGLSIGFASSQVEQLAATTILHGSIAGLSPIEAPSVVLPGCRLAASKGPGSLLIHPIDSDEKGF